MSPGTRKLSEVARAVVKPSGITATGWPKIEQTCKSKLGVSFDEWQCGAGRLILARRANGSLAATVGGVGMSLPRQVGKTYLLAGLIFALCIDTPGLLIIWSAHHSRTHAETFLAMQGFAKRLKVAPYIEQVYTGSGDEAVVFVNGSRILFGARERGFGRGIPGVDVLVMDEAQILSDRALENMLATLNTSQLGLHLYIGTPPRPEDQSEAFTRMRTEALSGESDDLVWIECGADPDADPDDRKQWAKANPSYPHRTPETSMMRLRRKLKDEGFRHEGLGIWDETASSGIFPAWRDLAVETEPQQPQALGVAASVDQTWLSLGAASGEFIGSVLRLPSAEGQALFVKETARIALEHNLPVGLQVKGPAWFLKSDLEKAGVRIQEIDFDGFVEACADAKDAVETARLRHANHDDLNVAVSAAQWRTVSDRLVISRKTGDVSMLEAAILARHTAQTDPPQVWSVAEAMERLRAERGLDQPEKQPVARADGSTFTPF